LVVYEITINGTGDILSGNSTANCAAAGVTTPKASVPGGRGQLVQ